MRVLYVQPYVPAYRVPLFNHLDELLRQQGGSLTVAASPPDGTMALRRDEATGPWLRHVPARTFPTPVGSVRHRDLRSVLRRRPDVVVMELDPANLNAWAAIVRRKYPLVLWGHGKTFTGPERPFVAKARAFLARGASHVMTYTETGRQALMSQGVPPQKITAVGNSTDTESLKAALAKRRQSDLRFSEAFGINVRGRRVFSYIGGLDADKRVSFLAEAARHAHSLDPSFLLLAAGSGTEQHHLERLLGHSAQRIPYAGQNELADLLTISEGIWMPGRIGLIAVDALTSGTPIHTTDFPHHAPEFDFLVRERDVHVHPDTPAAFAEGSLAIAGTWTPPPREVRREIPTVESVAFAMTQVIQSVHT